MQVLLALFALFSFLCLAENYSKKGCIDPVSALTLRRHEHENLSKGDTLRFASQAVRAKLIEVGKAASTLTPRSAASFLTPRRAKTVSYSELPDGDFRKVRVPSDDTNSGSPTSTSDDTDDINDEEEAKEKVDSGASATKRELESRRKALKDSLESTIIDSARPEHVIKSEFLNDFADGRGDANRESIKFSLDTLEDIRHAVQSFNKDLASVFSDALFLTYDAERNRGDSYMHGTSTDVMNLKLRVSPKEYVLVSSLTIEFASLNKAEGQRSAKLYSSTEEAFKGTGAQSFITAAAIRMIGNGFRKYGVPTFKGSQVTFSRRGRDAAFDEGRFRDVTELYDSVLHQQMNKLAFAQATMGKIEIQPTVDAALRVAVEARELNMFIGKFRGEYEKQKSKNTTKPFDLFEFTKKTLEQDYGMSSQNSFGIMHTTRTDFNVEKSFVSKILTKLATIAPTLEYTPEAYGSVMSTRVQKIDLNYLDTMIDSIYKSESGRLSRALDNARERLRGLRMVFQVFNSRQDLDLKIPNILENLSTILSSFPLTTSESEADFYGSKMLQFLTKSWASRGKEICLRNPDHLKLFNDSWYVKHISSLVSSVVDADRSQLEAQAKIAEAERRSSVN